MKRFHGQFAPGGDPEGAPDAAALDVTRLLTTITDNLVGMIYRCRIDANWTMEYVSDGCHKLTGYRPDELKYNRRLSYETLTTPEDRTRVARVIHAALQSGDAFEVEYRIRRADGRLVWVLERGVGVRDARGQQVWIEGYIQDISERMAVDDMMREAVRRYESLFENATEGIFQTTPDGHYLSANPALAHIYGHTTPDELITHLHDIEHQLYVQPERRTEFVRLMQAQGTVRNFESRVYRRDGSIIWISENARAVKDSQGAVQFYEGTVVDITERREHEAALEYQAHHDSLTGLPNRTLLRDRIDQAIAHAWRHGYQVAVVFVDLDHFKLINDSLGHHVGDRLLLEVAARLKACVRGNDTVARQGGDEFVLVLTEQHDEDEMLNVVSRLLDAVSQPWSNNGQEYGLSCSIGISCYPRDGEDPDALLRSADAAMYQAKASGRNTYHCYTPELNQAISERLELETSLRHALDREEFRVYYQPRIDVASGRVVGAEALIRWDCPGKGIVPPDSFISIAEETGLIIPIGQWILHEACRQNSAWRRAGLPPIAVSVNLSPIQFRHTGLVDAVAEALAEAGLDPKSLELEVTESFVMHDAERINVAMQSLKSLGVDIAVDDFGTGYSSLSYLKRFPVDRLKIDKSFVRDIDSDPDDAAIVRAIITLGHALNLRVVAEGVETAAHLDYLKLHGCDEVQGYYFSRPVPAMEMEALLDDSLPGPA
ncbi:MAG: GGDEF domain-containing protein [Hydrogenophilales bacterium 16-64-46]|nr:MAG: GGDEF domain-containing protein [Hydrogenophilales bacterium 12-64-13]OYZ05849.1 MAG: GGDEF domain-containing protein [Hydrogenophilales bacterium 16-64-46]OZA39785.1 MAG: GGDEF domain-containing protein [Hydrogenophilales bacterium 17-64-34]HQS98672.1 EAL domain-containing protein [Thiobacillus sp.]